MKKGGKYWVGFDLGGTKMSAVVFDSEFGVLGERRRKTKRGEDAKTGLARIRQTIEDAVADSAVTGGVLGGIGVGAPGPVDMDRGIVPHMPNLPWRNVKVSDYLAKAFECPVFLVNDVDAGTYGEYRMGAAQGARCAIGVFPGTGIGAGCVYEGGILRGRGLSCFELGHIQVQPDGPLCGCGQRGCLESVASRLAISTAVAAAGYRGQIRTEGGGASDLGNIRSGFLVEAIQKGDPVIERIVRDAARWLGIGVAAVVNLMLPDVVVLGGGLVEKMPKLYQQEVESVARQRAMPGFGAHFKVRIAKLGDQAVAGGAAAWAARGVEGSRSKVRSVGA